MMTLECSFLLIDYLGKVTHERWLGAPTIFLPSSDNEQEMFGWWTKEILKSIRYWNFCNFLI